MQTGGNRTFARFDCMTQTDPKLMLCCTANRDNQISKF